MPTIYEQITNPKYRPYNYYINEDDPNKTYILLLLAMDKQTPTIADIRDPNSGAFFNINSTMAKDGDANGTLRLDGEIVDPRKTWVEIDPESGKILNTKGHTIITGGDELIPVYGSEYRWHPSLGWYKPEPQAQMYDADKIKYAETVNNAVANSYWNTGNGYQTIALNSNPYTDQNRIWLNGAGSATNAIGGLLTGVGGALGFEAAGIMPTFLSYPTAVAGGEGASKIASLVTDNPRIITGAGLAGTVLGAGLGVVLPRGLFSTKFTLGRGIKKFAREMEHTLNRGADENAPIRGGQFSPTDFNKMVSTRKLIEQSNDPDFYYHVGPIDDFGLHNSQGYTGGNKQYFTLGELSTEHVFPETFTDTSKGPIGIIKIPRNLIENSKSYTKLYARLKDGSLTNKIEYTLSNEDVMKLYNQPGIEISYIDPNTGNIITVK